MPRPAPGPRHRRVQRHQPGRQDHLGEEATATASWTFTGLGKGSYDVYITYAGYDDYSNAAPFTVYDGSKSLATDHRQ